MGWPQNRASLHAACMQIGITHTLRDACHSNAHAKCTQCCCDTIAHMEMRLAFSCDCRPAEGRIVTSMEMVVKAAKQSDDGYYDMRFLEVSSSKHLLHPKLMGPIHALSDIQFPAYVYSAIRPLLMLGCCCKSEQQPWCDVDSTMPKGRGVQTLFLLTLLLLCVILLHDWYVLNMHIIVVHIALDSQQFPVMLVHYQHHHVTTVESNIGCAAEMSLLQMGCRLSSDI